MHHFDPPPPPPSRRREIAVWAACIAVLVLPSLLVWIVRGTAYAFSCAPGPELCNGLALGGGLRDALDLAWFIGLDTMLCIGIAFIASLAALKARRPLTAALTMLVLPVAALALPAFAVFTAWNADCMPNEEAVGDCLLWGARLGMTAHDAVKAEYQIFGMVPYTFAIALMMGVIGFLFFRPHEG
ncbi:MAG TPA: hypothetical protein VIJ85_13480 [Rhizomicrobium sp.]